MFALLVSVEESYVDLPAAMGVDTLAVVTVVEVVAARQLVVGVLLEEEDLLDSAFAELASFHDKLCDGREGQVFLQLAGKRFVSSTEVDVDDFICGHIFERQTGFS